MKFTFKSYENFIKLLKNNGYSIADYHNYKEYNKCVILRHDVDYDLEKALKMAQFESLLGVKSTYFLLVTSDFYNVFSKSSFEMIKQISDYGHDIGLHFDEVRYKRKADKYEAGKIKEFIMKEISVLETATGLEIKSVSMHRPSKETLESNLNITGIINSYSNEFFKNFKYLSDSRMYWRENVEKIVSSNEYNHLHILTHAFWYFDEEKGMKTIIKDFVDDAKVKRYDILDDNITDLESLLSRSYI